MGVMGGAGARAGRALQVLIEIKSFALMVREAIGGSE